jgi:phosphoenolpyruvate synthase/pyruvate phosphate dikinase
MFDINNNIRDLNDIRSIDRQNAGSKVVNLAVLLNKGFMVPPGFAILTPCFNEFMIYLFRDVEWSKRASALFSETNQIRREENYLNWAKIALITDIPVGINDRIKTTAESYGFIEWAVRSSSTIEDTPRYSFAGQYDSFLNIAVSHIPEYVRRCWLSFFSPRAVSYRHQHSINSVGSMAVLVQKMINADHAGVIFTTSGQDHESIVIEVGPGSGKVVSGEVIPYKFVIDRESLEIVKSYKSGEVSRTTILRLAELALNIEQIFGTPQDIEFCIEESAIWILQSRPITA